MGTMAAPVRAKGFTLIELLIALVIFGLVVGIASYGYSLFTRHWEGRLGRFEQAQAQFQRLDLVLAAIENTLPYVVRDEDGRPGFYFLGRDEGLTLVTTRPVFSVQDLAVIRVFRERQAGTAWSLVYEEASLGNVYLMHGSQELPFSHRMKILENVREIEFGYFGWASVEEQLEAADNPESGGQARWFADFDGLLRRQHPQRIAMRIDGNESVIFVPDRADASIKRNLAGLE